MSSLVEHSEFIDVRDLAKLVREQADVLNNVDENDPSDVEDAHDTFMDIKSLLSDLGYGNVQDSDEAESELEEISNRCGPTLISEDYFVQAIKEDYADIYGIRFDSGETRGLVIDWNATAEKHKQDYSAGILSGTKYWIRKG